MFEKRYHPDLVNGLEKPRLSLGLCSADHRMDKENP